MAAVNVSYEIRVNWDDEAEVWVAESDDVPGLIAEGDSRAKLSEKLAELVPELLEANNVTSDSQAPIDLVIHFSREAEQREERIRLSKAA